MIGVTIYHNTGRIYQRMVLMSPEEADMNVPDGGGWVEGRHDPDTKWVDNDEVKDRPELDVTPPALVAGGSWHITLPVGTVISILGADNQEDHQATTDVATVEVMFDDPGKWVIEFDPPFPYRATTVEVEVT